MLLAFDLDKTIVTNDLRLPQEIIDGLEKAKTQGHLVTILTGRPQMASNEFLELLNISEHYSTNHGAYVVGENGKLLRWQRLDPNSVHAIMQPFLHNPKIEFACIEHDTLFVRNPKDERWKWVHTQNRFVKLFHDELELNAEKIVFTTDALGHELKTHLDTNHPELITYAWDNNYLEVTSANSDKGSALELLAQTLGVEQKDTIAFGDGPNDTSMLEWAGHSVSVGPHAHPDSLEAANEHIASPEELGVAKWLELNLL